MQLDFKLNEKENLSCTVLPFPAPLELFQMSVSEACPSATQSALSSHSHSCTPEETGKCIVDSTVSSLYHTIKPCAFYCILFLYACFCMLLWSLCKTEPWQRAWWLSECSSVLMERES